MKIGFVIPARLASRRLKSKILLDLNGKTVLERVIERARKVIGVDEVVIATTSEPESNIVTKICLKNCLRYYLGDPKDVFERIKNTAEFFGFDYIINITPDNPLFSVYLVELMIKEILKDPNIDFLKISQNSAPIGSWPYLLNIKLMKTISEFKSTINTEVWGILIREEYFNVKTLELDNFYDPKYRLTLDQYEDYRLINAIYREILKYKNFITLNDALAFLEKHPEIANINSNIIQKPLDKKVLKDVEKMYNNSVDRLLQLKKKYYGGK